jgi:hypothetical protein
MFLKTNKMLWLHYIEIDKKTRFISGANSYMLRH